MSKLTSTVLVLLILQGIAISLQSPNRQVNSEARNLIKQIETRFKVSKIDQPKTFTINFSANHQKQQAKGIVSKLTLKFQNGVHDHAGEFNGKTLRLLFKLEKVVVEGNAKFAVFGNQVDAGHFKVTGNWVECSIDLVLSKVTKQLAMADFHVRDTFESSIEMKDIPLVPRPISNVLKMQTKREMVQQIRSSVGEWFTDEAWGELTLTYGVQKLFNV